MRSFTRVLSFLLYFFVMNSNNKSTGEEIYASSFKFKDSINDAQAIKLRDFLYKYSFNLSEAYEYLFLVQQMHEIEDERKTDLFGRIYAMGLQCLALSIRKMTDNSSERSVKKLLILITNPPVIDQIEQTKIIDEIYKHYDNFLNKFVVHQDVPSIHEALSYFPDTDLIINDLRVLREHYLTIVQKLCTSYINVDGEGSFFTPELEKLLS